MSDLTVRFLEGQFTPPIQDNPGRVTPTTIVDTRPFELQSNVVRTFLWQKAKQLVSTGIGKIGDLTGNRTLQRNLQFLTDTVGDLGTVTTGLAIGGAPGGLIAGGTIVVQKGIQAFDINLNYRKESIDASEQARKYGFIEVNKGSEYR